MIRNALLLLLCAKVQFKQAKLVYPECPNVTGVQYLQLHRAPDDLWLIPRKSWETFLWKILYCLQHLIIPQSLVLP